MVVVDSSVWVDYFNSRRTAETNALDSLLGREEIVVGDLILTEVLQGFREDEHFEQARRLFRAFTVVSMLGPEMAERSAQHYRLLRKQGTTVRKTIDVMIGTYCISHKLPLLYSDRDFDPMVAHLGLKAALG